MAFFETEWFTSTQFLRSGGPGFNVQILGVQSGQEQRNSIWANPRAEYQCSIITPASENSNRQGFIDKIRTFWLMVGGQADGFRFYDQHDCIATNEPMALVSGSIYQLQKTYSLNGRTYVRTIYKPINASVKDYQGNSLANTISVTGGTIVSVDHTNGQVTLSGVSGTPTASFKYHIPVRFDTKNFEPEAQESEQGLFVKWSFNLIEVLSPGF